MIRIVYKSRVIYQSDDTLSWREVWIDLMRLIDVRECKVILTLTNQDIVLWNGRYEHTP